MSRPALVAVPKTVRYLSKRGASCNILKGQGYEKEIEIVFLKMALPDLAYYKPPLSKL